MFAIALGLSPLETITVAISGTIFIVAFTWVSIKGDLNKIAKELIEDDNEWRQIKNLLRNKNDYLCKPG